MREERVKRKLNKYSTYQIYRKSLDVQGGAASRNCAEHYWVSPEMGVLSDGAGQFDVFVHALCWLHVERPLGRLVPHNEKHRQAIERIRQRIWDLYTGLKAYQQAPSLTARDALAKQFDELVADRTDYPSIDGVLKGMAADRAKLLLVLQRPEVPLHNNLSE